MYEIRSSIEREHQFPVEIYAECEINKKQLSWIRGFNEEKRRTTNTGAKEIIKYDSEIQNEIKIGNKDVILPIYSILWNWKNLDAEKR